MKKLSTLALLAGLAAIPALSHAEHQAMNDSNSAPAQSTATIAYGPPVVYYGNDDWERPAGTQARHEQQVQQFARAKAIAEQSELAAAQWQQDDVGRR